MGETGQKKKEKKERKKENRIWKTEREQNWSQKCVTEVSVLAVVRVSDGPLASKNVEMCRDNCRMFDGAKAGVLG